MNSKTKNCSKQTIFIKGMHCRSCEIMIEENLLEVSGIKKAVVKHSQGSAEIYFQNNFDSLAVKNAIKKAGYELGIEKLPIFSDNLKDYIDLIWAFFLAVAIYFILRAVGLFEIGNLFSGNFSSLWIVFLVGLTAGVSSCMAMIGGLVLGISSRFSEIHPNATGLEKLKPHLIFNLSRIIFYSLFGGIIGLVGSFVQFSPTLIGLFTIAIGVVMLLLGGQLIDIFPFLKKISFTLPKQLSRIVGLKSHSDLAYSHSNAIVLGALTFFLPCGFTQAMQLYAMSSGSFSTGALTMGVFALGTSQGLLGIGGLTSFLKGVWGNFFFKLAGLVVIYLSLINFSSGLTLLGVNSSQFFQKPSDNANSAITKDGVQEVQMTQNVSGYAPNYFIVKKDVPVRWIINSTSAYSCASSLIVPKYNIRKNLKTGQNIIEFTPNQLGIINFSCSMGMYSGSFKVVE